MSLATDLLSQARHLTDLDRNKPKQANLRRAVSAAYYALFHLLVEAASRRIAPMTPLHLGARIARTLAHGEMKEVCAALLRQHPGAILDDLLGAAPSSSLRSVAESFVRLQDARQIADYDTSFSFRRTEVATYVDAVEAAFVAWNTIRNSDEANVFLAALLFAKRWSR